MRVQGERKIIRFKGEDIVLTVDEKGLYTDKFGGYYALRDQMLVVGDPVVRCGVGVLSLPEDHPLTEQCRVHDFLDSSPEFLHFHTNEEGAIILRKLVKQTKYSFWAQVMYRLVQIRNWLTGRK